MGSIAHRSWHDGNSCASEDVTSSIFNAMPINAPHSKYRLPFALPACVIMLLLPGTTSSTVTVENSCPERSCTTTDTVLLRFNLKVSAPAKQNLDFKSISAIATNSIVAGSVTPANPPLKKKYVARQKTVYKLPKICVIFFKKNVFCVRIFIFCSCIYPF